MLRFGGNRWLGRIAVLWGVVSCAYGNEVATTAGATDGTGTGSSTAPTSSSGGGGASAGGSGVGGDGAGLPLTGGAGGCDGASPCVEDACLTSCGSQGLTSCVDPCAPLCVAPVEACNAVDDDCNASCDEGLPGCRVGVHRAYGGGGHLFSTDLAEASSWGTLESQNNFYLYASANPAVAPLYRCSKLGTPNTLLTTNVTCEGVGAQLGIVGYLANTASCGGSPLHRLHFPSQNWHFYTLSEPEVQSAVAAGWVSEGLAGYVWTTP